MREGQPNISIIRSHCEVELMLDMSARSLAKQSQGLVSPSNLVGLGRPGLLHSCRVFVARILPVLAPCSRLCCRATCCGGLAHAPRRVCVGVFAKFADAGARVRGIGVQCGQRWRATRARKLRWSNTPCLTTCRTSMRTRR
jgi:hypothetical protein